MRMCWINDCTGFVGIAPCCFDCEDRTVCPDKCHNTKPCNAVIEDYQRRIRYTLRSMRFCLHIILHFNIQTGNGSTQMQSALR